MADLRSRIPSWIFVHLICVVVELIDLILQLAILIFKRTLILNRLLRCYDCDDCGGLSSSWYLFSFLNQRIYNAIINSIDPWLVRLFDEDRFSCLPTGNLSFYFRKAVPINLSEYIVSYVITYQLTLLFLKIFLNQEIRLTNFDIHIIWRDWYII